MTPEDKQRFADDAERAVLHELTQESIDELLRNLGADRESLPYYGILKVCNVAAQIARAHALGIDPETLRMTDEEATAAMVALARSFAASGKPVIVIEHAKGDR